MRGTNRARYQARMGKERSLALKLARRLRITSITPKGRQVVVRGRISQPLADPIQRITVTRRVSAAASRSSSASSRARTGASASRCSGAKTRQVATFRFRTLVRFREGNPKLFRTFTLPQYVDIG